MFLTLLWYTVAIIVVITLVTELRHDLKSSASVLYQIPIKMHQRWIKESFDNNLLYPLFVYIYLTYIWVCVYFEYLVTEQVKERLLCFVLTILPICQECWNWHWKGAFTRIMLCSQIVLLLILQMVGGLVVFLCELLGTYLISLPGQGEFWNICTYVVHI